MSTAAEVAMERCDILAECTEEPGRIVRPFATDAMRCAHRHVEEWLRAAGMTVHRDNIGNLRGRYEGTGSSTLLLGSHLDSVRDAGKYDGPLGVMVAIAAVQRLHDEGRRLPFGLEVLAFADEEGVRFGTTYLGSRAVAGQLGADDLQRTDKDGITIAEAIRAFGGDPSRIADDAISREGLLGYCEVHIEQGPILEAMALPVGVVRAIAGQDRLVVTFTGESGHAGTVPMDRRRDALVVAAMFVIAVEHEARTHEGVVATVGRLEVRPGGTNVIPGEVGLSVDVRHADDAIRLDSVERIMAGANALAEGRGLTASVRPVAENAAAACSPRLIELLTEAAGGDVPQLVSGAGHDAVVMSSLTDVGMVFVRCKGGVSHNPAESVTAEDVGVAIDVLSRFLELLARR
jgi:allantoate deiminase